MESLTLHPRFVGPASPGPVLETVALWSVPWGLGVPAETADGPAEIADYASRTWIVNSRNTADEDAVRTLASLAGFVPRIAHEIDSLELVEDLIIAGYGVGLLPIGRPTTAGVKVLPLAEPKAILTAYEAGRRGRRCARYWTGCALHRGPNSPDRSGRARSRPCRRQATVPAHQHLSASSLDVTLGPTSL